MSEHIRVRGQVQGVGFRPFIWRLARELGVTGTVRNDAEGVLIDAHATPDILDRFAIALIDRRPPLSRIDAVERRVLDAAAVPATFEIVQTSAGAARTRVTPDAAICDVCRAEILDPSARRFGYAFANCAHCGPRFSIVDSVPYDREATTMRHFPMCAACCAEYEDPEDRRFHAQPIACPDCGPRIWLEADGAELAGDVMAEAAQRLAAGQILAIKGLGGFHLACDALDEAVVAQLRQRKNRPGKPFALMARSVDDIRRFAEVTPVADDLLTSAAAPIVLLRGNGGIAPSVAPGQWAQGWMLPATPLHVLLMEATDGPLVMTSGNLSGEPQVIGNDEARRKLPSFADAFLMHDRDIARRLDDPVTMIVRDKPRILRRARGYAPDMLDLPAGLERAPPVAAYGAHLKAAICLTGDGQALLSHHLGDLDDLLTAGEFDKADQDYAALFDHRPAAIACDLHPDYRSSRHAEARARELGAPLHRVQHHHAHIAAAMAENGWPLDAGPVIGVALDGLGLGTDGTVWGGELLLADYRDFQRVGWLRPVPLPGGDMAQKEPWRNLVAQLDRAGLGDAADRLLADRPVATLRKAVSSGINAPLSSSAGRLFDAVAAAAGIAPLRQTYEGEAAMLLEAAARDFGEAEPYPFGFGGAEIDPAAMWHEILSDLERGAPPGQIGARFHIGLADAFCATARDLCDRHDTVAIALSGGVLQNRTLMELCLSRLEGMTVLTHARTPSNDGSIALGQAVIAAARSLETQ